jgi:hypothetical protein
MHQAVQRGAGGANCVYLFLFRGFVVRRYKILPIFWREIFFFLPSSLPACNSIEKKAFVDVKDEERREMGSCMHACKTYRCPTNFLEINPKKKFQTISLKYRLRQIL